MPKIEVELPDDLYAEVQSRQLPASELLQHAIRAELRRLALNDQLDRYIADLEQEVGAPTADDRARAEAIGRQILDRPTAEEPERRAG